MRPTSEGAPRWWTDADQAELDCLVWELVDGYDRHRERCASCRRREETGETCPHVRRAIEVVLDWRHRRSLLSRARWLRVERELFEIDSERERLEQAA